MYGVNVNQEAFENNGRSKLRVNREYLLRKSVAADFNTYLSFSPFWAVADVLSNEEQAKLYNAQNKNEKYDPKMGRVGVRSIFNKSGAVLLGGKEVDVFKMSDFRATNNVPLIDTPENRKKLRKNSGCTIRELVEASEKGMLGTAIYSYSDFMYCKYLGQIPNNYLITLRRFPTPVDDYISTAGMEGSLRKEIKSSNPLPIGELVTWMNTPDNKLEDILRYSVSMPYEQKSAKIEEDSNSPDNQNKPLNAVSALFDKTYRQQAAGGYAGTAVAPYLDRLIPGGGGLGQPPYSNNIGWRDNNKVYGPVDAVKKTYYRGDEGIDFLQSFDLTFEYELRSYNGINGRQAMLDLISNILNVTYTTGTFWGGGYRGTGAHQNNIFANLNIMKTQGGFTNFMDAFMKDASSVTTAAKNGIKENGGFVNTIKNLFNDLGGMLMGSMLNKLGRPQKQRLASLLSPAPTGLWHVTIGNPFHPIMTMGNMILKSTTITHMGPLGLDDFPTGLKVKCELERGKPRDLRGIEMIYMNGNDRIYSSMGPKIFDMYTHAKEYKSAGGNEGLADPSGLSSFYSDYAGQAKVKANEIESKNKSLDNPMRKTLMKYFGQDDTYSIYVQAAEQEYGAYKNQKVSTGDTAGRSGVTGK